MGDKDLAAAFGAVMGDLSGPMFVVTTAVQTDRAGCLIGFATQASIHPARFLACLSVANHTLRVARRAEHLAVHVLDRDRIDVARLFGGETGDEIDKFTRTAWQEGPHGLPILEAASAWFTGRIVGRLDLGDHVGHLLAPTHAHREAESPHEAGSMRPLAYADVAGMTPGHDA